MAIQMKEFTIRFDPEKGGPRRETEVVAFNKPIRQANAFLKGFNAEFSNTDREFNRMMVDIDVTGVTGNIVNVAADFALRDRSGNFDDRYEGLIQGVVLAETA